MGNSAGSTVEPEQDQQQPAISDIYPEGLVNQEIILNYLTIPVLLSYKPVPVLSLQAGPNLAFC